MKLKIKIKALNPNLEKLEIYDKGDWIDLRASKTIKMKAPQSDTLKRRTEGEETVRYRNVSCNLYYIPLGVAMQLPKGFEAILVSRSCSAKKFGIIQANAPAVIDNSYSGDNDEWKFQALSIRDSVVNEGDRICQFKIQLSQKANMWQKIKWLLSDGIEFEYVEHLNNEDRGGFGSSGTQ